MENKYEKALRDIYELKGLKLDEEHHFYATADYLSNIEILQEFIEKEKRSKLKKITDVLDKYEIEYNIENENVNEYITNVYLVTNNPTEKVNEKNKKNRILIDLDMLMPRDVDVERYQKALERLKYVLIVIEPDFYQAIFTLETFVKENYKIELEELKDTLDLCGIPYYQTPGVANEITISYVNSYGENLHINFDLNGKFIWKE